VTVFDNRYAGITRLDVELLEALRRAASSAEESGVEIEVNSGWRSPAHQERLLAEAVAEYGSAAAAARWVATARTSAHVAGQAVDVAGADAVAWLSRRGAAYGLCRIYRNEPWHFELRPTAPTAGCPAMYADPAHDPRMQR
jgi:LAS superfamily LD-carboxypeptidase LdcB